MIRFKLMLLLFLFGSQFRSIAQNQVLVDSLEQIVQSSAPDSTKAQAYFKLTWNHLRYNLSKSREYATKAQQLTQQMDDSLGMHRVYHYWGLIHRLESSYDSSLFYFQKVVDFHTRNGRADRTLQALFNMGVVSSFKGYYDQSLEHYLQALKIAEDVEDRYMVAEVQNSLGIIHKKLKNYPKALEMTYKALAMAEKQDNLGQQANCLGNIGSLYAEMERYDSALVYFKRTYAIDSVQNIQWGIGHQLNNIGRVYTDLGEYRLAEDYLMRGLEVREKLEHRKDIAESLISLAILKNFQEQHAQAISYANRAKEIAQIIGDRPLLRDALLSLATAHGKLGNYRQAYLSQKLFASLNDSILNETTSEQINTLQIRFETEKKEKEIAMLTRDKEIQQATILQKNTEIKALTVVAVLVLLLMGLLFVFFRAQIKNQKLITQKNKVLHQQAIKQMEQRQKITSMDAMVQGQEEERKRIAKDLHDGLGNLLANVQMRFSAVETHIEPEKQATYQSAYQLLGDACGEVRRIAHNMMPSTLTRFGLVATLNDMKEVLEKNAGMQVDVQVYGIHERLPEKIEITLYRLIQELMNNIVKHAKAQEVIIQLAQQGDELNLLVEDDGVGFDWEAAKAKKGLGLSSLESRIHYIDGTWEVDTAVGKGTSIMVNLPLKTKEAPVVE